MATVSAVKEEEEVEEPLKRPTGDSGEDRGGRMSAGLGVLSVLMLRSESSSQREKQQKAF